MKEVIREYGSTVVTAVGAFLLFTVLGQLFFQPDGLMARMVELWGNGGC